MCDEGELLEVMQWVFAGTALVTGTAGAAWLIWVADDGEEARGDGSARNARGALTLRPSVGVAAAGLHLRLAL